MHANMSGQGFFFFFFLILLEPSQNGCEIIPSHNSPRKIKLWPQSTDEADGMRQQIWLASIQSVPFEIFLRHNCDK